MLFSIIAAIIVGYAAKSRKLNLFVWCVAGLITYLIIALIFRVALVGLDIRANSTEEIVMYSIFFGGLAILLSVSICKALMKSPAKQDQIHQAEYDLSDVPGTIQFLKNKKGQQESIELTGFSDTEIREIKAGLGDQVNDLDLVFYKPDSE